MVYPRSIAEKLQFVETVLDGVIQHLEKGGDGSRYLTRLRRALGCVRSMQAEYPQPSWSLLRLLKNTDELPWERGLWMAATGRPRSLARIDWGEYRRRRRAGGARRLDEFAGEADNDGLSQCDKTERAEVP